MNLKIRRKIKHGSYWSYGKEEFEDLLHEYKIIVNEIISDGDSPIESTIECVSPLLPLNLEQKKNYIKILINER